MRIRDNRLIYAPCRCGSGKKYKFCCFRKDRESKDVAPLGAEDIEVLDLETGERLNTEGMQLMQRQQFESAQRTFRKAIEAASLVPAAHNNLALVTFILGDADEAIRIQENILKKVPIKNDFGEANLVHFYLAAGREKDAEQKLDAIEREDAADQSALGKQCEALARFDRHQAIHDKVKRYRGIADGAIHYFAGMAAANLGDYTTALDRLLRVSRRDPHYERASHFAKRIKAGEGPGTIEDNWPYFDASSTLPRSVFERMASGIEDSSTASAGLPGRRILVDMLVAFLNSDGLNDVGTLEFLGQLRHPRAIKVLERIAQGMIGSDEIRSAAMRILFERGVWNERQEHLIWLKGQWIKAAYRGAKIDPELATAEVDPELEPLYVEAVEVLRDGQFERAEALWRRFLKQAPDFYPGYHNLAVALIHQGLLEEPETLLREALAIDPNYIFAPCTLTVLYLQQDRVDEAHEVMANVAMPQEAHPEAMAAFCSANIQLALAEGNIDQIRPWLDMGLAVDPENDGLNALKKRLALPLAMDKLLGIVKERSRRRQEKLRRRVLSLDTPLENIYADYTKGQLFGITRMLELHVNSSARKAHLLESVVAGLRDAAVVQRVLAGLSEEERAAFNTVFEAGGSMDYAVFTRTYGTDADDGADWDRQAPKSLIGRLKCRGLLVEGIVNRRPAVFIPSLICNLKNLMERSDITRRH